MKYVALLFTRLADLFGNKAANRGLIHFADKEKNMLSEAFKLWCRKLADLTEENFRVGLKGLEQRAEAAYRDGDEMWPPSYAEFRALCFPKNSRDAIAHKPFARAMAIEDQTAKAARYELGKKKTNELLGLFGEEPEMKNHSNEHAKAALELAKKRLAER